MKNNDLFDIPVVPQNVPDDINNVGEEKVQNEIIVNNSQEEKIEVLSNNKPAFSSISLVPETLDQDFGVIPPAEELNDTSEEEIQIQNEEQKEKIYKKSKKIKWILIILVLIVAIGSAFVYYQFYLKVNPKTIFMNGVNKLEKNINKIDVIKNMKSDTYALAGNIVLNSNNNVNNDNYVIKYNNINIRENEKSNYQLSFTANNNVLFNYNLTFFKNALFIKYIDQGHNFRILNDEKVNMFSAQELNALLDMKNEENILNYLISSLDNNISKKDFSSKIGFVDVNKKRVLVNKYNIVFSKKKINTILKEFFDKLKNDEELKTYFADFNLDDFYINNDIKLSIYVGFKGVVRLDISNNKQNFRMDFSGNNLYCIYYNSKSFNLDLERKDKNNIDLVYDNKEYKYHFLFNFKKEITNLSDFDITIEKCLNNKLMGTVVGNNTITYSQDVSVALPNNVVNKYSDEGNELYNLESYNLFDFLKKIL